MIDIYISIIFDTCGIGCKNVLLFLFPLNQRSRVNLSNMNLSIERVRKFMCMLPNKFSHSPDGIPSAVLRILSYELCTPLNIIFEMSINSGTCPSLWKNADRAYYSCMPKRRRIAGF